MTITAIHSEADITDDDRATALVWFAEQAELRWTELDPVLPAVVAALAHQTHVEAGVHMALFDDLLQAVKERGAYVASPRSWVDLHDLPTNERALDQWEENTQRAIDLAAFDLVHPGPSCVTCRRVRPRQGWRATYGESLFCPDHLHANWRSA